MKKTQKMLCLLLAVLMTMTVFLAGCGSTAGTGTETTAATTESTTAASTEPEVKALEPVTLTWYVAGGEPKEKNLVEEEMTKQVKDTLNATIKLNWIDYGNYGQKMNVMLASGEDFDLCLAASWLGFGELASKGAYYDIKDLLPKVAPNLEADMPKEFWDAATVKGAILAVPNRQRTAYKVGVSAIIKPEDAERFQFQNIKTYEDWLAYVEKVGEAVKKDPAYKGATVGLDSFGERSTLWGLIGVGSVGNILMVDTNGDQKKIVPVYDLDVYKTYLKRTRDWFTKGYVRKDVLTWYPKRNEDGTFNKNGLGVYGSLCQYVVDPNDIKRQEDNNQPNKFIMLDIGAKKYLSVSNMRATMTAVNKNSKNPERALMLVERMNLDQKLYNTMCFGVEGRHWKLTADNQREIPEEMKGDKSPYNPNSAWQFGNTAKALPVLGDIPATPEMLEWDVKDVVRPQFDGFAPVDDNVKSEIAKVNQVMAEMQLALEFGTIDPEKSLPVYVEKLKKAGIEKIMEDYQKQLDAFYAGK